MEWIAGTACSNLGSLLWSCAQVDEGKRKLKPDSKLQQVADESVVVMKSRPEKASNGVEEKTGMIRATNSVLDFMTGKIFMEMRRGEVSMKIFMNLKGE